MAALIPGLIAAVLGILLAYFVFYPDRRTQAERDRFQIPLLYPILRRKYFLDDLYWVGIVQPIKGPIARGVNWINTYVIDGIVNGVAAVTMVLSRFVYRRLDQSGIDGIIGALGRHRRRGRLGVAASSDRAGTAVCGRSRGWCVGAGAGGRGFPIGEGLIPMELLNEWGLTLVVFLPVLGALVMAAIPRSNETAVKRLGALVAVVTFLLSLVIAFNFDYDRASAYQFEVSHSWISAINANYHVGIDGISLPLLILSTFIVVLSVIYSWNHWEEPRNPKAFLILMLILATGMNGTFAALDLVLFFIFFEVVLLPMYFMIGIWGDKTVRKIPGFSPGDRNPPLRGHQVLPLHAVRFGVHAAWASSPSTSAPDLAGRADLRHPRL